MMKRFVVAFICFTGYTGLFAQFTSGNIVVLQVGDGTGLSNAGTPVALQEFTPIGGVGITVNIPSTGAGQHVISGTATSEGLISLSSDQTKIIIPGYAAPAGTAAIAGTSGASVNRAIASVDGSGTYTQNVLSSTFFSANNIRGAASDGANNFWATGANTGYCYFGTGTPSIVSSTSTNNRATCIVGGNLTFSSGSGTRGIYQISGMPTAGTVVSTLILPTGGTSSPFQYAADLTNGVVYVADDRTTASGGGIQKWVFSGTWNLMYTFDCGSGVGARGLVVDFSGANPVLYATTADASANRLIKFTDAGVASPLTLLATSPANKLFRGLAFAPNSTPPPLPVVNLSTSSDTASEAGATVVTVTATSSSLVVSNQTVNLAVTGTGITGGDYNLSNNVITINAGTNSGSVTFTVVNDVAVEGTETANLTISSPSAGIMLGATTSKNIVIADNDNPPPTVHFSTLHQSVLENTGSANVGFTMTTAANAAPCKIIVTTSVHTTAAGGGVDYTLANDTVIFPAGSNASQNLVVNINDDVLAENAEYVSFKVGSIINGILGTNQYHILYIRDNDYTPPTPTNEVMLQLLTSFSTGAEGSNSAEIVAYDAGSQKLVTANSIANKLDIIDFTTPGTPGPITSISLSGLGGINSVDVRNGFIAVALQGVNPQDSGKIAFYNMAGTLVSQVTVGAMPDMITFNHAGTKVYTACEGEPTLATYAADPEGGIAVVDISGGVPSVNNSNVTLINFNAFDSQIATLRAAGVRIYGNNGAATVSQDFEPEYITISDDDQTAWVTIQEANAMAKINLATNTVTSIIPLGKIDHSLVTNGLDASDQTSGINIANFPVKGLYEPDAITHMNIGGTNYIFTANEGDTRADFGALNNEESRISTLTLDPTVFVDQNILKSNFFLGRLSASNKTGDTDSDGDIDELQVFGGRGFSVWSENGVLLFNSGNLLEKIIAGNPVFSGMFNATNTSAAITAKNRSDDKGPEIEGVAVANIDGDHLLFVSSERIGGVFIFNIDNPVSPRYIGYYNNRSIATNGPDRGAEGILYISADDSPNGNDLVILANEITSTLTIYQVNTCASLSGVDVNFAPDDTVCSGEMITFSTPVGGSTNLQWLMNNTNIVGATGTSTLVNTGGNYSLAVQNTLLACSDTTAETWVVINPLPAVGGNVTDNDFCIGTSVTFNGNGANSYSWTGGVIENTPTSPSTSATYTVTGTDGNGCTNTATVSITVHNLPAVVGNVTDNNICAGDTVIFNGTGASSYLWTGGVTDGISFIPSGTATYTVTGTDVNTCSNTDTISLTVNTLPTVSGNVTDNDFCEGTSVTFNGNGALSYIWSGGVTDNTPTSSTTSGMYTVTGTDGNGCSNTATVTITVHPLPTVGGNVTDNDICIGSAVTFNGTGAVSYLWTGGVINGTTFTPTGTATYTVTGTDANTCTNTATVTVTVHNLPIVGYVMSPDSVCISYPSFVLTGGTPAGGNYTGTGVTGSSFDPGVGTGDYVITYSYTDANGCTNTDTENILVSGCLAIYNEPGQEIYIYPNPTDHFFYIQSNESKIFTLRILDMSGKVVMTSNVSDADMIDVSILATGTYIVELTDEKNIFRSQLIKK